MTFDRIMFSKPGEEFLKKENEILILSEKQVKGFLKVSDAIRIVEETFKAYDEGKVVMSRPACITIADESFLIAMPGYVTTIGMAGVKWIASFPHNLEKRGIPTHFGLILLNDPVTGLPVAIMGGNWITAARTAAATAVGAKYLAKRNAKVVGIIGAGVQGTANLEALNEVLRIELVKVTSIRKESRRRFANEMGEKLGLEVRAVDNSDEVVRGSDVIVNATPSDQPFVKDELAAPGVLYASVGTHQGCDDKFPLYADKSVVDYLEGFTALGMGSFGSLLNKQIVTNEDVYAELGQIVAGRKRGRASDDERILFFNSGMAMNDVAVGDKVYALALKNNVGRFVKIFSGLRNE